MNRSDITLFVHREGCKPQVVQANASEHLDELLTRAGVAAGVPVFVGECEQCRTDDQDEDGKEDAHDPANPSLTLENLGLHHGGHVHCHRCRRVEVMVHYGSGTRRHKFSPATTVASATVWAKKKYKLTDSDAVTYVLQITGTNVVPQANSHLGELVHFPKCELCFDIVPSTPKVEG
jgi:hypothetical protein